MKTAGKASTISESRLLSRLNATNQDTAAYEQEVDEQVEQDHVERAAREIATSVPFPIMRGSEEMTTADDAAASGEEVEEQVEESRIHKVAFENE